MRSGSFRNQFFFFVSNVPTIRFYSGVFGRVTLSGNSASFLIRYRPVVTGVTGCRIAAYIKQSRLESLCWWLRIKLRDAMETTSSVFISFTSLNMCVCDGRLATEVSLSTEAIHFSPHYEIEAGHIHWLVRKLLSFFKIPQMVTWNSQTRRDQYGV